MFATFVGTPVLMCVPLVRYHAVSDLYILYYGHAGHCAEIRFRTQQHDLSDLPKVHAMNCPGFHGSYVHSA